jgi:enamine deaminase RidA (YjgF/YER057c/UK114 family)
MEGAQVVIESIAVAKKPVNPHGIAFISGQAASTDEAMLQVTPLAAKSMAEIRKALAAIQLTSDDVVRATCFCSSLQDISDLRRIVSTEFPKAVTNYVQMQRAYTRGMVECEAVARLKAPMPGVVRLMNPSGLPGSASYSHIAMVNAPQVVISGTQLAFRQQDDDVRLAFERLKRVLEQSKASLGGVVVSNIYALSGSAAEKIRSIRFEFYDKTRPPASTMLLFEGLPSLDASFGVDVVAVPGQGNW